MFFLFLFFLRGFSVIETIPPVLHGVSGRILPTSAFTQSSQRSRGLPSGLLPVGFSSIVVLFIEPIFLNAWSAYVSQLCMYSKIILHGIWRFGQKEKKTNSSIFTRIKNGRRPFPGIRYRLKAQKRSTDLIRVRPTDEEVKGWPSKKMFATKTFRKTFYTIEMRRHAHCLVLTPVGRRSPG